MVMVGQATMDPHRVGPIMLGQSIMPVVMATILQAVVTVQATALRLLLAL